MLGLIFSFGSLQVSAKLLESFSKDVLMTFCLGAFLFEDNQALKLVLWSEPPHSLLLIFRTGIYESPDGTAG